VGCWVWRPGHRLKPDTSAITRGGLALLDPPRRPRVIHGMHESDNRRDCQAARGRLLQVAATRAHGTVGYRKRQREGSIHKLMPQFDGTAYLLPRPERWMSITVSDLAWMSVRDAAIVRALLLSINRSKGRLTVLEWGSGRSTLGYTAALREARIRFLWVSLEHHREFFLAELSPSLVRLPDCGYYFSDDVASGLRDVRRAGASGIRSFVFDAGELRPFERGDPRDLSADLDDYVNLPTRFRLPFDVVLVDGRKRRRCLLAAAELLKPGGIVILHDGWRRHYQCAFAAYEHGWFLGDELWVGSHTEQRFVRDFPPHVFEQHADANGKPTVGC
jgi:hypothetical protein